MPEKKKRRKKHKASVLQKKDGRCYLCMMLHDDHRVHLWTEEHHVFFGTGQRWKSEEDGMKVYLCPEHHRTGPEAVHLNHKICRMLQRDAQKHFEKSHTREEFRQRYGRSYFAAALDEFWERFGKHGGDQA